MDHILPALITLLLALIVLRRPLKGLFMGESRRTSAERRQELLEFVEQQRQRSRDKDARAEPDGGGK